MEVKEREKGLLKNTGILAIGTLCSKALSFFLLPLYTAVLTTNDFGQVDILQTVSAFIMPFVTLQLCSGIFRFIIDKETKKEYQTIITTGVLIEVLNVAVFSLGVFIFNLFCPITYSGLFIFYFASMALLDLTQQITRGFGDNTLYTVMNFTMTVISLAANLIMILGLGMKGDSILIASSTSFVVASVLSVVKLKLWQYIDIKSFSKATFKELAKYCLPLIPNAVSWWIANSSDRIIILFFLGAGVNGIYAAANKIPTIYITLFNVYNLAWAEAASRCYGDSKEKAFLTSVFSKSVKFFSCLCLIIICFMSLCFNLLIGSNYRDAYPHVYILLLAIFFNSLCSIIGSILTAYKRSDLIGSTTVVGAVVNIIVNLALIKFIGLYAASISTLVSYIVIAIVRARALRGTLKLKWPIKFLKRFGVLFIITSVGYFSKNLIVNAIIFAFLVLWCSLNNQELIKTLYKGIVNKFTCK